MPFPSLLRHVQLLPAILYCAAGLSFAGEAATAQKPWQLLHASDSAVSITTASPPCYRALPVLSKEQIFARQTERLAAYRFDGGDRVVVLDFPNLRDQALVFVRIILFVEREGTPRTRVMPMSEVRHWLAQHAEQFDTLTLGNNFRAVELARFFNTARLQNEPLIPEERRFLEWLSKAGLLTTLEKNIVATDADAIVITVPQASTVDGCMSCTVLPAHRHAILEHELSHARFATDPAYQNHALNFWSRKMSDAMRERFTQFLRKRGYDATNQELLANETQAFLMHTPHAGMFGASAVGITEDELRSLRRQFQDGLTLAARLSAD